MNKTDFVAKNGFALKKLLAFVTLSQGFTLGFIESARQRDTEQVIEYLKTHSDCGDVEFVVIDCADPQLESLLAHIQRQAKAELETTTQKEKVLIVRGLEQAIGVLGDYPTVLVDLNFSRDAYARKLPYPLILVLPDYAITRVARFAPDFWAWKSGEFNLAAPEKQAVETQEKQLVPEIPAEKRALPVSQGRFDLLNNLLATEYTDPSQTRADLLLQRSLAHESHANYQRAEEDAVAALELYRQLLPKNHLSITEALNQLAEQYHYQGKYEAAEPLYIDALQMRKELLGDRHPYVATSLNNLAALYESQGKYEAAEPLYLDALEILKELLGDRHPDVATSLNNLAGLYYSQGKYEAAEPLYINALQMRKELLGDRHPDVATSLNNLGCFYLERGNPQRAQRLLQESLAILEEKLGLDHSYTQNTRRSLQQASNLANLPKSFWGKVGVIIVGIVISPFVLVWQLGRWSFRLFRRR